MGKAIFSIFAFIASTAIQANTVSEDCINRLANSVHRPTRIAVKPTVEYVSLLSDVLPEYDPETELLVSINDIHMTLYFGKYLWDYHPPEYRLTLHPKTIPRGLVVRVRIGRERVARLEAAIENKEYTSIVRLNCHHGSILFLQRAGIVLGTKIPILGYTMYVDLTEKGFKDDHGRSFEHVNHLLYANHKDPLATYDDFWKTHHVDHFFTLLGPWIGMGPRDIDAALKTLIKDPRINQIPMLIAKKTGREAMTPYQRSFVFEVLLRLEQLVQAEIEKHTGTTQRALDLMTGSEGENIQPALKQLFGSSLHRAVIEVAARHGVQ